MALVNSDGAVDQDEGLHPESLDDEGIKDEETLLRKISLHILPLFLVMVVLCYIDRTNLAFAGTEASPPISLVVSACM
jgi:hypothetical protein